MLAGIYISALLVDEELADQVREAWDKGEISAYWAAWMWWQIGWSGVDYMHWEGD